MSSPLPIFTDVLAGQLRSFVLWGLALGGVAAMYTSFWPLMDTAEMAGLLDSMPEALIQAMGYDRIGTPGGYITSTVYGLVGPALLLVYAISKGARLIAGEEEDGTLELELTAPVSRLRVYFERLAALWVLLLGLTTILGLSTYTLVLILKMAVPATNVLAGTLGLLLFLLGMGTSAFAVGATFGRRALALGLGSALAVAAFMLNAIGPVVDLAWMSAISPFSWYLGENPLDNGFDVFGLLRLAIIPPVAAAAGWVRFLRRDLGV